VMMASSRIRFIPEAKVFYRISSVSRLSHVGRSSVKMEAQFRSMELNIQYIRSVEDSSRVRAACVAYLQRFLPFFYPEMPTIVKRAEELASVLGGRLRTPRMSWKYLWIQKLFGWTAAKAASVYYNQCKSWALRTWDKTMFRLEGGASRRW
jgi:tRNA threonylcarbamoyladenosine modification (KEOPS) complex  Pcc1 subunit